jgi:hypothetical protein
METNMFFRTIHSAAISILLTGMSGLAMAQSEQPNAGASTTGAAPTDLPNPPGVFHIPSARDAAKFNAAADADDKKPTMAHALGLTAAQRQMISSSLAGGESAPSADFKPEVTALMPKSAKVQDFARLGDDEHAVDETV